MRFLDGHGFRRSCASNEKLAASSAAHANGDPPTTLATTLGNTEPGDGARFKGRGPIQVTGRANYRRFCDLLGLDLVSDPPRAANPDVAFRVAGLFWSKKGLNELADARTDEAFREITRRINGGFNGLDERRRFYAVARTVLGVAAAAVTRGGPATAPRPRAPEPDFERGWEAVRADVPKRRRPKRPARKAPRKRTRKTAAPGHAATSRKKAIPARKRTRARTQTANRTNKKRVR